MEWGGEKIATLKRHYRQTGFAPPALAKMPSSHPLTDFLLQAFFMASPSRPVGFDGASPVPFSDWRAVCDEVGYTALEDRAFLISALQDLDQFYLSRKRAKMPKKPTKNTKPG